MSDTRPTLVFGLVAAVGANLSQFMETFCGLLKKFDYEPVPIHLTELLREHVLTEPRSLTWSSPAERLETLMTAGDNLRSSLKRGDAMALLACLAINGTASGTRPRAHVIRQLKHPEEIATLRRIYGDRFFSVALYSTREERLAHMTNLLDIGPQDAGRLMQRDEEDETNDFGQRTRATFELADVFIRLSQKDCARAQEEAQRFLDLIFGAPDVSPTADEHAMYLAYAASFRSADLSRQVGASIVSAEGDAIAVGANDVPQAAGGQYWPGEGDRRDHYYKCDSNHERKMAIARDLFLRIHPDEQTDEDFRAFLRKLDGSLLNDITEYGRAVHAEMEAILSCSRAGARTRGATLYSTTFPCHNCAKHIVGAGVREVHYVEPYPKSLASPLHDDSIHIEDHEKASTVSDGKVIFRHYVGVGPRRYVDLFSLKLGSGRRVRRKVASTGALTAWKRPEAAPRVPSEESAKMLEDVAVIELKAAVEKSDEN